MVVLISVVYYSEWRERGAEGEEEGVREEGECEVAFWDGSGGARLARETDRREAEGNQEDSGREDLKETARKKVASG